MYSYKSKDSMGDKFPILGKIFLRLGISILLAFLLSLVVSYVWVFSYKIVDSTMLPKYNPGDRIWFSRFVGNLAYDEIVLAKAGQTNQFFLGRIKGLPGERIYIQKKKLQRNGKDVKEESIVFLDKRGAFPAKLSSRDYYAETRLGQGEYFVLCDNRDSCLDSRDFGPIKKEKIIGKKF